MTPTLSDPSGVCRVKSDALNVYTEWKIKQLLPTVQSWAEQGCDIEEIKRRLDGMRGQVFEEGERVLRCITIEALKEGANDNG